MAGITQTIPSYTSGISEQPDQLKAPGQVVETVNSIPDLVKGLYKRPGAKRVGPVNNDGTDDTSHIYYSKALIGVQSTGSFFNYYRDETEGGYIGQIATDGTPRIWSCKDAQSKTIHYGGSPWAANTVYVAENHVTNNSNVYRCTNGGTSAGSGGPSGTNASITDNGVTWTYVRTVAAATTLIKSYLASNESEDIQALTINDTTFLNNRSQTVNSTGTTTARPEAHFAYVQLLRSENGRQYGLNVYDDDSTATLSRATRIKIASDTLAEGENTGTCAGIGTQVFSVDSGTKKNLIFRITTLGQQGQLIDKDDNNSPVQPSSIYSCSYNRSVTLLHGGEGWQAGDTVPTVTLDQAKGGGASGDSTTKATYTIAIEDHENTPVKANIKLVRPAPTPFDADTAVTVDTILGGIQQELDSTGISYKIIGNGIYLHKSSAFNVEVVDQDLMRVMGTEINDVTALPLQCRHGAIVKISNTRMSDEDDYYLKFIGENNLDGPGRWEECAAPGIVKSINADKMPHVMERLGDGSFAVRPYVWADRGVGDNVTNPIPSFIDQKINKVVFFRNRLALLSGENIITSQPGNLVKPDFWADTALTVSGIDPMDISCSSTFPSDLYDAIEIPAGLLCFSTNEQFLFSSDAEIMNPDTAKLRSVSMYNYHKIVPPISLGATIGYIDNSNKYSRFMEMASIAREQEAAVVNTSEVVPRILPKNLDLLTNSRENGIVLFGKTNLDTVIGYKYINQGENRIQSAWFKWKFNVGLKWHFIFNDEYYFLDSDDFLQKINLVQSDEDLSIDQDNLNYPIHLDNWTRVTGWLGNYNPTTDITEYENRSEWIDEVTSPNGELVALDLDTDTRRLTRYSPVTIVNDASNNPDDFSLPGNWEYSEYWELPSANVNTTTDDITLTTAPAKHNLETGDPVKWLQGVSGASGLTNDTVYYVIKIDDQKIRLATTEALANAFVIPGNQNNINITSTGTGTHTLRKQITNIYLGYVYEYNVKFPRFYLQKVEGKQVQSDVNSKLTIHRAKLNFGKVGYYETTLNRVGKSDYTEIYESTPADQYEASDAPFLDEVIKEIPVYERNTNVELTLKSSHPSPATLRSLSWEGDYSPMHYRRV